MRQEQSRATLSEPGRPWGVYPVGPDAPLTVTVGPRILWLRIRDGELWVSHSPLEGGGRRSGPPPSTPAPDDESWERWATEAPIEGVELRPCLPPRPIVLQPERTFRLTRGAGVRVYVRVPLWIQVRTPGTDSILLEEIPSTSLSDTWWGDTYRGELAFWLATTARRRVQPEVFLPHLGVCPLQIRNGSTEELRVEKLLLAVDHLALYEEVPGRLWTDLSTVRYQGEEEGSVIDRSGAPPDEAPEARPVSRPRTPAPTGFRAWTFQRLRGLPGLGMST